MSFTLTSTAAQAGFWDFLFGANKPPVTAAEKCKEHLQPPKPEVVVDPKIEQWIDSLNVRDRLGDKAELLAGYQEGSILPIVLSKPMPNLEQLESYKELITNLFAPIPVRFASVMFAVGPSEIEFKVSIESIEQRDLFLIIMSVNKDIRVTKGTPFAF